MSRRSLQRRAGSYPALLFVAFLQRVAGVAYGLPDVIYHSDTTKQLLRVVPFMRGDLVPEDTRFSTCTSPR